MEFCKKYAGECYSDYCKSERGVEFPGYAQEFVDESTIAIWQVKNVAQGDINRYTIVYWLEGEDPESFGMAPLKAQIKLGIEINATEMQ